MSDEAITAAIDEALRPGRFFVAAPGRLRIERASRMRIPWELYRGHLLDPAQTRETACFDAWHVALDAPSPLAGEGVVRSTTGEGEHFTQLPPPHPARERRSASVRELALSREGRGESPGSEPIISVLWHADTRHVFVTRKILTYGFEAYEDSPGVILSRPVQKWVRELVGTIDEARLLRDQQPAELATYVFLAVNGTSRLPITSLESPLPAFSLGQLAYLPGLDNVEYGPWTDPLVMLDAALRGPLPKLERAKALETALRAARDEQLATLADSVEAYAKTAGCEPFVSLIRTLFGHVALSPYTNFVGRLVGLLVELAARPPVGAAAVADLMGGMLIALDRHLTAFDLTLFHNYGANYPDALFLDCLLKACLGLIEEHPELTTGVKRRRALRQACLVRRRYEGHPVPDVPTSLGENQRVLPAPLVRVPEEQIADPRKRRKMLFEGDPLESLLAAAGRETIKASVADLRDQAELAQLGMAWFLDRPLGIGKTPGEVDRTPLVSHQAFSRSIVKRRLAELHAAGWLSADERAALSDAADGLHVVGMPARDLALVEKAGVVSLADALKAAPDFVFLRTTRHSLQGLLRWYNLSALAELVPDVLSPANSGNMLLVHHLPPGEPPGRAMLRLYDGQARLRAELGLTLDDGEARYVERRGVELAAGLQVLRVWQSANRGLVELDVRKRALWMTLCE